MKILLVIFFLCISLCQVQAQKAVNISGQVINFNSEELLYLIVGEQIFPIEPSSDGNFAVDCNIQELPAFFYLEQISKQGKRGQQSPLIWFESDNVEIQIDWTDKSFKMEGEMPFQAASEKIESLKSKEQIEFILNEPIGFPSLYFADRLKEKISIADLDFIFQKMDDEFKKSVYAKRIESYLSAKKRPPVKIGSKVEDFILPDNEGDHVSLMNADAKPKLIALLSSGCAYSVASIRLLEQFAELNNERFELITIWEDSSKEMWLNALQEKKKNITWTNLWDEFGFASTYLNRKMLPTFYVISADGLLTDKFKGYTKNTARKLKELVE